MSPDWSLDPQLAHDTVEICDLSLCQVRLMNDANYPWLILIPRRHNVTEIIDLAESECMQLMREIAQATNVLKVETACHKINVAAIGNLVSQLHVHVIARFRNDGSWPKPVWGALPARAYEGKAMRGIVASLRERFAT